MRGSGRLGDKILTSSSTGALHPDDDRDRGFTTYPRKSQSLALLRADALAYAESDKGGKLLSIPHDHLLYFILVWIISTLT